MALSVIHRYKHTDETGATGLNARDVAKNNKGVIRGNSAYPGTVVGLGVATPFQLRVNLFKAISFDGMVVINDAYIDFDMTDNQTFWVVLHAVHGTVVGGETLLVNVLTDTVYLASPFLSQYVVIAKIVVPGGATEILSSYIEYDDSDLLDKNTRRQYRGTVTNKASLPTEHNVTGDIYVVLERSGANKDSAASDTLDFGFNPALWIWGNDGSSGALEWYPVTPHANLQYVNNRSGSTISSGDYALLNGMATSGNSRILPTIIPFTNSSVTVPKTFGLPVFAPYDILNGEDGWVVTQGLIPHGNAFTPGNVLYFNSLSQIIDTLSGASHVNYCGPVGIAFDTQRIWFNPSSAPVEKERYGKVHSLSVSDAVVNGAGVAIGNIAGTSSFPKGVEFPTGVTGYALWAINMAELMVDSAYDGVHSSGTGNKFLRVRFQTVYVGTDVANVRFRVKIISQKASSALLPASSATPNRTDEEIIDVATTAVVNTTKPVVTNLGDGLFILSGVYLLNADETTDWMSLLIERQGAVGADTAIASMFITAIRVDFDMKPIDRIS